MGNVCAVAPPDAPDARAVDALLNRVLHTEDDALKGARQAGVAAGMRAPVAAIVRSDPSSPTSPALPTSSRIAPFGVVADKGRTGIATSSAGRSRLASACPICSSCG